MKVLFVSSGTSGSGISSIVKNQGESIRSKGIDIQYFTIKSSGFSGYVKNIFILRRFLALNHFDLIHAHYGFSGIVATLATSKPLVVSLMGSDIMKKKFWLVLIKTLYRLFWNITIVKASWIKDKLKLSEAFVIPNGVNLKKFKPINKLDAQKVTGFDPFKKHIVFIGNPLSKAKNVSLIYAAYSLIKNEHTELHIITNTDHELIPQILNSADVLVLSSLWEGSPNVIKEAMACDVPIVTTPVGDTVEMLQGVEGCYLSEYKPEEFADNINKAIKFGRKTNGRGKVLAIDESAIAESIIKLYEKVLSN